MHTLTAYITGIFLLSTLSMSTHLRSQDIVYCGTSAKKYNDHSGAELPVHQSWTRQTIIVPVVVHIVWNTAEENLSDEVIFQQIDWLNKDFNGENEDLTLVHSRFTNRVGNPGIQFCLADTDPSGNPSDGITRTFTNIDNIGAQIDPAGLRSIKHESSGGADAWDISKYVNIWVGARNDVIGDATLPQNEDIPLDEDGIVIKYDAFGSHVASNPRFNRGRTLTHEMGHFFNLLHLFGNETGCDTDGDFVEDTPEQSGPYFDCPDGDSPVSCGSLDMESNFMNFRDDQCMHFFTKGQSLRMLQSLFTHRYDLLTSGICENETVLPPDPLAVANIKTTDHDILMTTRALNGYGYEIILFDITGRRVLEIASNPVHAYQIDAGPPGIYVLQLVLFEDEATSSFVRKVFIP